jgi:hypothetical protein
MSTPSYRLERLLGKHRLLRVPARARRLRLVLERFTPDFTTSSKRGRAALAGSALRSGGVLGR